MRKIILLLIVGLAVSFTACNKLGTDPLTQSLFVLNDDVAALQQRITDVNEPLDFVTSANKSTASTITYSLQNVWNLAPADALQSASSVAIDGNDVYVGFHVRGKTYNGEILKVSQSSTKALASWGLSSILVDVNDLEYHSGDNALYIAGESHARGGEALMVNLTSSGVSIVPDRLNMPIFGASGNSVTRISTTTNDYLWVSSGGTGQSKSKGGLVELDLASTPTALIAPSTVEDASEAKHFDAEGVNGLWIYGNGSETYFNVFNALTSTTEATRQAFTTVVKTGVAVTDYGKNAVDVEGTEAFVAMGASGVFKIDLTVNKGATINIYFDNKNIGLANGIAAAEGFVFVANGADGLIVLKASTMDYVGRWNGPTAIGTDGVNYDDNGSCNYVAVGSVDVDTSASPATTTTIELFVAFGRGGLMKLEFVVYDDGL